MERTDKIEGDTIVIYDDTKDGDLIIRKLKIVALDDEAREYGLKRTPNVKYMLIKP